jgi:hypothetical protein
VQMDLFSLNCYKPIFHLYFWWIAIELLVILAFQREFSLLLYEMCSVRNLLIMIASYVYIVTYTGYVCAVVWLITIRGFGLVTGFIRYGDL